MPLRDKVKFSKEITTKKGYKTLGLFNKDNKLIDTRVCEKKKDGFKCPKDKAKRAKLAKKIGVKI